MRKLIVLVVLFGFLATFALPLYLGPDDIAGCVEPTSAGKCQAVDAIVAISGGDTMARADEAIRLYNAHWSNLLVFSGAALDKSGPSNAAAMRSHALAKGIPEANILIEETSTTTSENAANTAKLISGHEPRRLLLVTSAYHQRRASIEFQKAFGESVVIVNHPVANDNQWSSWWWMTPYGWWLGIGEVIKIIFSGASNL